MSKWRSMGSRGLGGKVNAATVEAGVNLLESLRPLVTCPECGGDGKERSNFGAFGVGRSAVHPCPTCHGTGKVKDPSVGPEEVARRTITALHAIEFARSRGAVGADSHHEVERHLGLTIPEQETTP